MQLIMYLITYWNSMNNKKMFLQFTMIDLLMHQILSSITQEIQIQNRLYHPHTNQNIHYNKYPPNKTNKVNYTNPKKTHTKQVIVPYIHLGNAWILSVQGKFLKKEPMARCGGRKRGVVINCSFFLNTWKWRYKHECQIANSNEFTYGMTSMSLFYILDLADLVKTCSFNSSNKASRDKKGNMIRRNERIFHKVSVHQHANCPY